MNQSVLIGLAAVAIIGIAIFAVSSMPGESPTPAPQASPTANEGTDTTEPASDVFADGTYEAVGEYSSPAGPEEIAVSVTLEDGVIVDSSVEGFAENEISIEKQQAFAGGYQELVIGQPIDSVELGVVSGSSLTPIGFNNAIEQIKADATAAI